MFRCYNIFFLNDISLCGSMLQIFYSSRSLYLKENKKLSLMKQDELNRGSQKTLVFIEINKHSNRCMYSSFFGKITPVSNYFIFFWIIQKVQKSEKHISQENWCNYKKIHQHSSSKCFSFFKLKIFSVYIF